MGNQNRPRDEGWLRRTLSDILARVRALETAPRTRHAGVSGGTLRVTNGGRIVVGDSSGYTITIDPDPVDDRPRVSIDLGDAGVAELGAIERDGATLAELRVTAPSGAVGLAGVAAEQAGLWLYPDGTGADYVSTVHVEPDEARLRFNGAGGTARGSIRAAADGASLTAYDSGGTAVSGIWASTDGNVYHRGPLEPG